MLRLFRKIRKKLIENSMFRKYLLYAVGEVLILILGILIALQVNNWNEIRQKKIVEISILKTFKTELEKDYDLLKIDFNMHTGAIVSMEIILNHLEGDLTYNDTLAYHFINGSINTKFAYQQGALETLKSTGVNIITNEELRNNIVELYTNWFDYMIYLTRHMDGWQTYGAETILNTRFDQAEYFDDYSTEKEWDGSMIPLNYEQIKNDDEYKYFLRTYRNATKYYIGELATTRNKIHLLTIDIGEEIDELEK